MRNKVILNEEGYFWPINDNAGKHNTLGSCWYGLTKVAPNVPENVSKYVDKKIIAIQAGGNCGYYVKKYASIFKFVYTFEPDPVNFYCLNLNVTEENVIKFQACLGETHQGVSIGNFMLDVGAGHIAGPGLIPVMRIDDLALPDCNLIHIDIEGYELFALKGAINTIQKFKPTIVFEYYEDWARRYNTSLTDIDNLLTSLGYEFVADVKDAHGDKVYQFKSK